MSNCNGERACGLSAANVLGAKTASDRAISWTCGNCSGTSAIMARAPSLPKKRGLLHLVGWDPTLIGKILGKLGNDLLGGPIDHGIEA